jgi:hypothetical protein
MSGGVAIFFVIEAIRGWDAHRTTEDASVTRRAMPIVVVVAALGLAGVVYVDLGIRHEIAPAPGGLELVRLAVRNDLHSRVRNPLSTPTLRRVYGRAMHGIRPDRTIVAVDRPYLIDYSRYDVQNLDAPGYVAPGGEFPFFSGPGPKIARLRRAGFEKLVATNPESDACLSPKRIQQVLDRRRLPRYRYRHVLDWDADITTIAREAPTAVTRIGPLLVIDLPRAQRSLAGPAREQAPADR